MDQLRNKRVRELSERLSWLAGSIDPAFRLACRAIQVGDEHALMPAEAAHLAHAVVPVLRASGAGRIIARALLAHLDSPVSDLPRAPSGAALWPNNFVGSIAHDAEFAIAAVVSSSTFKSIGVDVEPTLPLPSELLEFVATRREQEYLRGDMLNARLLFCLKEAVYKATHPCDGVLLAHHDVEVSLASGLARTRTGYCLRLHCMREPRMVAVATMSVD